MNKITLVTGLWDIKRNELGDGWNRSYNHYLEKLTQLLNIDNNLILSNKDYDSCDVCGFITSISYLFIRIIVIVHRCIRYHRHHRPMLYN